MITTKLKKSDARKVLEVIDQGLTSGLGKPNPGQMCVRKPGRPVGSTKPLAELFWAKVNKCKDDSRLEICWEWVASRHKTKNRGSFHIAGKSIEAHRASWIINCGPIPEGLSVLHVCDNPICVRPTHLFLGTQSDNMRDMVAKGRHGKPLAKRTHCKNGHEFTTDNTGFRSQGNNTHRQCKACVRINNENWRSRNAQTN